MGSKQHLAIYALAGLLASVSIPAQAAADAEAYAEALEAAKSAQKQAAEAKGEWRDTGKLIKKSEVAAKEGNYDKAIKLADEARRQGYLGRKQALDQRDIGLPDYLTK